MQLDEDEIMKNKIHQYRIKCKMSQKQLALRCGVSRQTINAVENGKYDPSLVLAFRLVYILKTSVHDLFQFDELPIPEKLLEPLLG